MALHQYRGVVLERPFVEDSKQVDAVGKMPQQVFHCFPMKGEVKGCEGSCDTVVGTESSVTTAS